MDNNELARPKFAVLMAAYNGMQYIAEQTKSILQQIGVQVTLFISVDRSTDGTEAWANELAKQDSRVYVLPQGMQFGGAAKNFFHLIKEVELASFDYVAFADQDDYWYPDKLLRAVAVLQNGAYDAYSSNVLAFWPNGKELLINKAQPQKQWDYLFEAAGPGCTYVMSQKLMAAIKKQLLAHWDELQNVALHDWFCYAFARAQGFKWFIDPKPSMHYRQHASNQVGVNRGVKAYLNRWQKINNGWWLSQAYLISQLVGENFVVSRWMQRGRLKYLALAKKAFRCRRQWFEQVFFIVACVFLAIRNN